MMNTISITNIQAKVISLRLAMKYVLSVFLLTCFIGLGTAQGSLTGHVVDVKSEEAILFCTVALYNGDSDKLLFYTESDLYGCFQFLDIPFGNYRVEASYVGYQTFSVTGIQILSPELKTCNFKLDEGVVISCGFYVLPPPPLIDIGLDYSGATVFASGIRHIAY